MNFSFRTATFLILLQITLLPQQKELMFEDLFSKKEFNESGLTSVNWMKHKNSFSFLKYDSAKALYNIYEHNIETGEESVIIYGDELKPDDFKYPIRIQNYLWSPDGKYILFTGVLPARKTKSGGNFYLYDTQSKKLSIIADSEEEQVNAAFSPDGKMFGFVRGNNIYVYDIEKKTERQLTFDGSENILNGLFDWVYEEEFSIIVGWEWSPDSKCIAYWRLDQSNVPDLYIAKWDSLYMQPKKMKYPKPGAANSLVQIGVVDINTAETVWMDLGNEKDIYIPRMQFSRDPGKITIQRLNRLQNKLELLLADTRTGRSEVIITETSDAWVEVVDELKFINNDQFIWGSERDGYRHLYLYKTNGTLIRQLTKGNWEINSFAGLNEKNTTIYFTANERGTIYSDLYSINYDASHFNRLTEPPGTHSINFSLSGEYYIDKYSTANSLTITTLHSDDGRKIKDLVVPDMTFMEEYSFAPVEFLKFTTSDGVELNASIMKPDDFDPDKKYPVLFHIYGGPGSSSVIDQWGGFGTLIKQYLVKKGYIIFTLDNRGTGNRGTKFRHIVYKNLGRWEVNDMIEGAEYLISEGYADPERIGIWGSSYGGYTSIITLLNAADYFKAAIAVASVTDWQFYDNIYTERFMQTPEMNPRGYEESSTLTNAGKLKGKLLLVHGTADDNVHFQNTVMLVNELINQNKQFELMIYPERAHGIRGGMTPRHFYKMFINFIKDNL